MRKRTAGGWEKHGKPLLALWEFLSVEPGDGLVWLREVQGTFFKHLEQYALGIKPSIVGSCL